MRRFYKILILNAIVLIFLGGPLYFLLNKLEAINPIAKAIQETAFTDIYFSKIRNSFDNGKLDSLSNDIYIINIGYQSVVKTRSDIAELLEKLNTQVSTKAIGLDIIFDGEGDSIIDSILVSNINKYKPVLACNIIFDDDGDMLTNKTYISRKYDINQSNMGYTNLLVEKNTPSTERYFLPKISLNVNDGNYSHFSLELLRKADQKNYKLFIDKFNENMPQLINYKGDYLRNNKIIDIKDIDDRINDLKDKIIIVGQCSYNKHPFIPNTIVPTYNEDAHFTPRNSSYIGKSFPDMNGVEIHAHILASMLVDKENNTFDFIWSHKYLNAIIVGAISILVYLLQLYWFYRSKLSFGIFKHIIQVVSTLLCIFTSLILLANNIYFDLTTLALVCFFTPEIIEITEVVGLKLDKMFFRNYFGS